MLLNGSFCLIIVLLTLFRSLSAGHPNRSLSAAHPNRFLSAAKPNRFLSAAHPNRSFSAAHPNRFLSAAHPNRFLSSPKPNRFLSAAHPNRSLSTTHPNSSAEARQCREGYSCSSKCARRERYNTRCGLFGWSRCTRYRTKYYKCYKTCYRQVCCKGYTGSNCNTPLCYGSTSCLNNNPCTGPDRCSCKTGYQRPKCADLNECSSKNGGCQHVCRNNVGSFKCSCNSGYVLRTDLKTCEDKNECSSSNGGCAHTCTNKPGTHQCSCRAGYTLSPDGRGCNDINECSVGTSTCGHGCTNTFGSYTCSCRDGFQLAADGQACNDIDECSLTPFPCDHQCHNVPGSYTCGCETGYYLDTGSQTCTDVNECVVNSDSCDHICTNTKGSYQCSCRPGYVLHADGGTCTDVDECSEGTSQCSQKCNNTPGSYKCSCENGSILGTDQFTCININDCQGVTCGNGGFCIDNVGGYSCSCAKGYTGKHCELDLNECSGFLKGGCEDGCINTVGSFVCKCSGTDTLNNDGVTCSVSTGPSVFSRYGLVRQFLPRGCSTIMLAKCSEGNDIKILLSSTSKWYKLKTDPEIMYTYGIVFVEANAIALPVSISGLEVVNRKDGFELITGSLSRDVNDGVPYGEERSLHCWTFDTTPRDVRDFLVSNSFLSSFFHNIEKSLPDWLKFSPNGYEILSVNDVHTDLSRGDDIQKTECRGAPLYSERLYTVLKFGNSFAMSIYGQEVILPAATSNKQFCIIVDVCQDYGGSVFLILPENSSDILDKFKVFKKLIDDSGVYIRPIGIGLSVQKKINVHAKTTHLQQWNGDKIIQYPVFQEANIWVGGEARMETDMFRVSGIANTFISIPSPINILKSLFLEEWGFVVRLQAVGALEFIFNTPFGHQTIRASGSGEVNALASLGGSHPRSFCGMNANPAGVFMSVLFNAEAFLDAPLLRFIKPGFNIKAYVFLASDPKTSPHNQTLIDVAKEILDLKHISERFVDFSRDVLASYETLLSNQSTILLNAVITTGVKLLDVVEKVIQNIGNSKIPNLPKVIKLITDIWRDGWKQLKNDADAFVDSIRENTRIVKHNVTQLIKEEINAIRNKTSTLISNVTDQAFLVLKELNGAGFRFKGALDISGLKIIGLEIELVYSIDSLGMCSRFKRAYSVLKGERAVRALAVVSSGLIKLGGFLRIDSGAGIGLAISLDTKGKFAAMLRVEAKFLGIGAQTDLFITNKGLYLYVEGNVWNTFKAQLQISSEMGNEWYQMSYGVKGSFVADADGDGSFDDGYLAALRRFTNIIAEEANKRISKLQDGVTKAQRGLTSAQDWLEDKKSIFRNANSIFDDAVRALDRANDKLEDAKKPFQNALSKLREAQRKVDRLCRIKDCKRICIPGIKCKICHKRIWGVRIPYPCCKFTSCMISFPNPICLGLNLLCRAARGIAYLVLEGAKIFVRIPMLALDAAKVLVSAAKFIVDKSRVVLDIAIAVLDFAKLGLEAAKGLLEGAKIALEAVKQVVKLGFAALNFVIKYGLESIIDVRNCGFEVTLSTHDKSVFDVHCDVNAFKTGFKTLRIRINFNDIFQSLWYAAKATITAILKSIGNIFGRKRREIEYDSLNLLYKHYRNTRDTHGNGTDTFNNETIDTTADTLGFKSNQTDSEYDIRTEMFLQNCIKFTNIHSFMLDTIQALHEMANETASTVMNSTFVQDDLPRLNNKESLSNMSLTDLGIDPNVAETEFNISLTDLTETVKIATENLSHDSYLSDVERFSGDAASMLQNQTDDANKIEMVNYWVVAMENVTIEYFSAETCVSFLDCAHYAVASLYEMVLPSTDMPNKNESLQSISAFEDVFLTLTSNYSLSIIEVFQMSLGLLDHLDAISETNVFCSTPPTTRSSLQNKTVILGETLHIVCNATGNPLPTFSWFKNDEQITNFSTNMILTIHNVTYSDEGSYHCVATNLVTSLTMPEAYVNVTVFAEDVILCEGSKGDIQCPTGQKIAVYNAYYGRTHDGSICPHPATSNRNCRTGFSKIKKDCHNKQRCYLAANNGVYGDPCRGTYKYIYVKYACVETSRRFKTPNRIIYQRKT